MIGPESKPGQKKGNKMKLEITLTSSECELWNWAQSAAEDFWSDDEGRDDGLHFNTCPVSVAKDGKAVIDNHKDVLEDMLYRLGKQLPDMADGVGAIDYSGRADLERMSALRDIATANRICKKLSAASALAN